MPHRSEIQPDKQQQRAKAAKIERAKQYLTGSGVLREDSDDELGHYDYPWAWVYDGYDKADEDKEIINDEDNIADLLNAEATTASLGHSGRKRKVSTRAEQDVPRKIIGAKMG